MRQECHACGWPCNSVPAGSKPQAGGGTHCPFPSQTQQGPWQRVRSRRWDAGELQGLAQSLCGRAGGSDSLSLPVLSGHFVLSPAAGFVWAPAVPAAPDSQPCFAGTAGQRLAGGAHGSGGLLPSPVPARAGTAGTVLAGITKLGGGALPCPRHPQQRGAAGPGQGGQQSEQELRKRLLAVGALPGITRGSAGGGQRGIFLPERSRRIVPAP